MSPHETEHQPPVTKNARELQTSRVVSIRIDKALADRLDALCARTGRKRSFYLRAALERMLPRLEERYWADTVHDRQQEEDRQFEELIRSLTPTPEAPEPGPAGPDTGTGHEAGPTSTTPPESASPPRTDPGLGTDADPDRDATQPPLWD